MKFVSMCSTNLVLGDKFTNTAGSYLINYNPIGVYIRKNPATNNSDISNIKSYYNSAYKFLKQNEKDSQMVDLVDVPEFSKISKDGTAREWKQMALDFIENIRQRYKSMKLSASDFYSIYLNKDDWKLFKAKNYNQIFLKEIVAYKSPDDKAENEISSKAAEIQVRRAL